MIPLDTLFMLKSKIQESSFIRFLLVGIINTIFGYAVFAFFTHLGLHYSIAIIFSTLAGVLFNFKTIGVLVFKSSDNKLIFRFLLVYLVIYFINLLGLKLLGYYTSNHYIGQAILAPLLALTSYILNKKFVFTDIINLK